MTRLITGFLILMGLASPLAAGCQGTDLRPGLTVSERAALTALTEHRPYPTGNHWVATRGQEVLHLVGTLHLDDPRFDPVMDRLSPLIDEAATVMLELTELEQAQLNSALATRPNLLVLSDTSLPELMGDDWEPLAKAMTARGMPGFMAAKFRPWYVAMLLSMPSCIDLTKMADAGLDARIEARANARGIPTRALEAFDTAFAAFADVPLDLQVKMLRAALVPDGVADDIFATLLEAYFDQAHAESWAISEVLSPRFGLLSDAETEAVFADMDRTLLASRNKAWIPVILDTLDQTDGPVLAAFGAAHLSGEDGVLALLEAEGFALERRPF